jgi:hypothetical protein
MTEPWQVMMSAHALCPTDKSHPDRMRWMAEYFTLVSDTLTPSAEPFAGQRERFEAWWLNYELGPEWRGTPMGDRMWIAWQAAEAVAIEQCARIVETYEVSVGNSAAGEIACEMTMRNLREIRDEISALATPPSATEKEKG